MNTNLDIIKSCFSFEITTEYPNGAISITKENALKLQQLGWDVSFHTDYYLNYLGIDSKIIDIGFCGWMDNLGVYITNEDGYDFKIINREQLDAFLTLIDSYQTFNNLLK